MKVLELSDFILEGELSDSESDDSSSFDQIESSEVDYNEFYVGYLLSNRPCLIKAASEEWPAQKNWVKHGKPNFEFIEENYGTSEVPIVDCKKRYFNAHSRSNIKLSEYLNYWKTYINEDYPAEMPCLYLKDWHFANEYPLHNMYRVPHIFASDWINEYSITQRGDDYRFVYFGPKGSWTPLHADVFNSFSWSVNLCGRKKWVFFPPDQEDLLKDKYGKIAYNIEEDFKDEILYPRASKLTPSVFIQEVGDAIFVPSGWHHQVWNLEDTISINHNWVNACNIYAVWKSLNETFTKAQNEIADCRTMGDWDERAQLMLKICFGMDHLDFAEFLFYITEVRFEHLSKGSFLTVPGEWLMGGNQMIFDLVKIREVYHEMFFLEGVPCLDRHKDKIGELINEIDSLSDSFSK